MRTESLVSVGEGEKLHFFSHKHRTTLTFGMFSCLNAHTRTHSHKLSKEIKHSQKYVVLSLSLWKGFMLLFSLTISCNLFIFVKQNQTFFLRLPFVVILSLFWQYFYFICGGFARVIFFVFLFFLIRLPTYFPMGDFQFDFLIQLNLTTSFSTAFFLIWKFCLIFSLHFTTK